MLTCLFGNKNIQRILIFLFVNGKCYGTQLHRWLKTPLTPIQKALLRLERGGVILSYYEGKTRLYQYNPAFPLFEELQQLLKKSYTLLTPQEKKLFCIFNEEKGSRKFSQRENQQILQSFCEKLSSVKHLTFAAKTKSKEETGWNGRGKGEVMIEKVGESTLIFHERGYLQRKNDEQEIDFSNIFRWIFNRKEGSISLEHLRRGINHPVFLFYMIPITSSSLASIDPHLCEDDAYFGQITFDHYSLRLNWRVIGPKKNEEIDYYYACLSAS